MNILHKVVLTLVLASLSFNLFADEEAPLANYQMLTPATAIKLAQATLKACQDSGYQVAVAVVDRMGVPQVMLRDRFAGAHTPETATRKAWTAASFRTSTQTMAEETSAGKEQSGVRFVNNALMVGGGLPINAAGTLVGGIGVSGAPGGKIDEKCAQSGLDTIDDELNF
ncbi:MAG: heme-binding protein [Gammaproteobacteria bacterium]|nr:heme-binding protein [Gammaproteobacteria bacterium]